MADLTWCPTLDALYRDGGAVDSEGIARQPGGLSTPNNLLTIRSLMMALKPERTFEVGLAAGGSALTFAASHRDLAQTPSCQHTAIDPYQRVWHHLGKTLIDREGLTPYARVIEEPSCLALPDLMRSGEKFQLVYIDGSHAFHEAMLDFYYTRHLLDMGGVVLFDDCATPDIRRLMQHITRHMRSVKRFDLAPFRPPTVKQRLGSLLGREQCVAFQKIDDPKKGRELAVGRLEAIRLIWCLYAPWHMWVKREQVGHLDQVTCSCGRVFRLNHQKQAVSLAPGGLTVTDPNSP